MVHGPEPPAVGARIIWVERFDGSIRDSVSNIQRQRPTIRKRHHEIEIAFRFAEHLFSSDAFDVSHGIVHSESNARWLAKFNKKDS